VDPRLLLIAFGGAVRETSTRPRTSAMFATLPSIRPRTVGSP
jgi:hypothetical protein